MKLKTLLLCLATSALALAGQTNVTLIAVPQPTGSISVPSLQPSITFKPIGVGSDGATTYEEIVVVSMYLGQNPSTTAIGIEQLTAVPGPTITVHGTFIEGASHYQYSLIPEPTAASLIAADSVECDLNASGGGSCVLKIWATVQGQSTAHTLTATYTGTQVPFYTVLVSETQSSDGGRPSRGPVFASCMLVGVGVATGLILGVI